MKINFANIKNLRVKHIIILSVTLIVFFLIYFLIFLLDFKADWKKYQKEYKTLALKMATYDEERNLVDDFEIEIKQFHLSSLNRIDRCTSCHVSIDQKGFENSAQPLTTHPGNYLEYHSIEDFGCTICHGGLGMATSAREAHGDAHGEGSLDPMYRGVFVQSSCGKCHDENSYAESSVIGKGKRLYQLYGCNVCHKLYKRGGTAGPDLTQIGSKKYYDVDWGKFNNGKIDLSEWLVNHFKDPSHYYDSKMMDFKMNDENAIALAVYMLSLTHEVIPPEYIFNKK